MAPSWPCVLRTPSETLYIGSPTLSACEVSDSVWAHFDTARGSKATKSWKFPEKQPTRVDVVGRSTRFLEHSTSRELQGVRDCILVGSHRTSARRYASDKIASLLDLVLTVEQCPSAATSLWKSLTGAERGCSAREDRHHRRWRRVGARPETRSAVASRHADRGNSDCAEPQSMVGPFLSPP